MQYESMKKHLAIGVLLAFGLTASSLNAGGVTPPPGLTQSAADSLYVNSTGDTISGNLAVDGDTILGDTVDDTVTLDGPIRIRIINGALGIALWDGSLWNSGIRNVATKGISILTIVVNGVDVAIWDDAAYTVLNDFSCDGSVTLGKGTSGNTLVFRGMDSWTSQQPFTWHIDGDAVFDASGKNVTGKGITWDFAANVTNFTVPDATDATEAMNRQTSDVRYVLGTELKSGTVAGGSFADNPKVFTVIFNTTFPDTNYAVTIAGEDNRTFTYQTKLASSFVINTNANLAIAGNVDWTATAHSDP